MTRPQQPWVVAVDIGNSAVKWAASPASSPPAARQSGRVPLTDPDWCDRLLAQIHAAGRDDGRNVVGCDADCGPLTDRADWRIASVHAAAAAQLTQRLRSLAAAPAAGRFPAKTKTPPLLVTRHLVPMQPLVRRPDALGIDRLLAGWMATQHAPGRRLVVVDAGSAITVDSVVSGPAAAEIIPTTVIDTALETAAGPNRPPTPKHSSPTKITGSDRIAPDGCFLGGAIVPGLSLQLESLSRGTSALPALMPYPPPRDGYRLAPPIIPADDTESAIRSGVLCGTAGAIDRLIQWSLAGNRPPAGDRRTDAGDPNDHAGPDAAQRDGVQRDGYQGGELSVAADTPDTVWLTGGDAAVLSPWLQQPHVVAPQLVLDALFSLPAERR